MVTRYMDVKKKGKETIVYTPSVALLKLFTTSVSVRSIHPASIIFEPSPTCFRPDLS